MGYGEPKEDIVDSAKQSDDSSISSSPFKVFVGIAIYTSIIIAIIYFTSQNYISLRDLNSELPIKEWCTTFGFRKNCARTNQGSKAVDTHNAEKVIFYQNY